ncbi:dipeptidyl peptidase IV N-terminal region-domain-containing protein [Gongronella butleri]|nr:dipeptidyl peptidase IV N-terminal region-domain-containing protein [Gongronella butleri]
MSHCDYSDEEDIDDQQARLLPHHQVAPARQSMERYSNDVENGSDMYYSEKPRANNKRIVTVTCIALVSMVLLAWVMWSVAMGRILQVLTGNAGDDVSPPKLIQFDDLYNQSFVPKRPTLVWVEQDAQDGMFTYRDPVTNDIVLESIESRSVDVYVKMKDLYIDGRPLNVERFQVSQDAQYLTLYTNSTKQFRWSYKVNIFIYHLPTKTIVPLNNLTNLEDTPRVSYAAWSPKGHQLAYVMDNDIYVADMNAHHAHRRLTFDGSATVFNGVPDWVYEEEVFGCEYALWWSPEASHVAYLRFNETTVPEYQVPLYTKANYSAYPEQLTIKYPKAGAPNPLVSLHVHALASGQSVMITKNATAHPLKEFTTATQLDDADRLITDVTFLGNDALIFKQMNRVQDHEHTILVSLDAHQLNRSKVTTVREYAPTDGGWIEPGQSMVYLPTPDIHTIRYLDVADNDDGFTHLAIFSISHDDPSKVATQWLTSGDWEVVAGSVVVDTKRQLVHFISTERSFLERHLYTISLDVSSPEDSKKCLTCPTEPDVKGYFGASFSPRYGYYILNYQGPDVPRTVVRKVDDPSFEFVLSDNKPLADLLSTYDLPAIRMSTIQAGALELPVMEVLPPGFDVSLKYPVLFHVYGGPGSQLVSHKFALDWHTFVASHLGYIVVTVDGRGTGFQGRKYRSAVRGQLGNLETVDQVTAAKHWAKLDYVDSSRIAIWGWSYGGYMTTKVLESDDGVFAAGMAVAPVTDWQYYDSVYTERYMLTPDMNPDGYAHSAVSNMTGFHHADYLLVHGTGDDNVHFQHSAVLVDRLTLADVQRYRVQFYPDSDHRIVHHNANRNIYRLLTEFLFESFGGKEYAHVREETHGRFSGSLDHIGHVH